MPSFEKAWEQLEPFLRSHCLRHGEDDVQAVAAALVLALAAVDEADAIIKTQCGGFSFIEIDALRARIAARGADDMKAGKD